MLVHIATVESLGEPPQLMSVVTRDQRVRENVKALGYSVELSRTFTWYWYHNLGYGASGAVDP